MRITTLGDFRKAVRAGPYAWPGCYPLFWIMSDGGSLAWNCVKDKWTRQQMIQALIDKKTDNYPHKDWLPVAVEVNWEDQDLYCDHTGQKIESAYGEE